MINYFEFHAPIMVKPGQEVVMRYTMDQGKLSDRPQYALIRRPLWFWHLIHRIWPQWRSTEVRPLRD